MLNVRELVGPPLLLALVVVRLLLRVGLISGALEQLLRVLVNAGISGLVLHGVVPLVSLLLEVQRQRPPHL